MKKDSTIAIIGAGIGGLTTAIALKNKGIKANIYEASAEIGEVGAGIWMAANAQKILDKLGILEKIKGKGIDYDAVYIENYKGERLQKSDLLEVKKKYGYGTISFARPVLHASLFELIDPSTVHTSKKCIEITSVDGRHLIKFEDGTETTADLVVGADGIRSVVREYIHGKINYRYSGQTCWRSIVDYSDLKNRNALSEIWGLKRGQRMGYGYVGENKAYYYLTILSEERQTDQIATIIPNLLEMFSDFPQEAKNLIVASSPQKILRNDLYDFKPLKNWIKDQVVLLGDAAHATTPNLGQGACQAIESAYVLAEALSQFNNLKEALLHYQIARIKRAAFITNLSWQFGSSANLGGPIGNFIKFGMLKYFPKSLSEKQFDKVFKVDYSSF
jgi:FAD-dependent urate hydroxylase